MSAEALNLTAHEQEQITRDVALYANQFKQWAKDRYLPDDDILISCLQQADDNVRIVAANLQVHGNLHDVDIAFPPTNYTDVHEYIVRQLIAEGDPLIYQHDGIEEKFVPTRITGLWLHFRPTVRPHIVGLQSIPASLRTVSD